MKTLLHLTVLSLLMMLPSLSHAQWERTFGPFGWTSMRLTSGNGYVYASSGKVFRSSDNGMTWQEKSFGIWQWDVQALMVNNNRVFAVLNDNSGGYLYTSDDNGEIWMQNNSFGNISSIGGIAATGNKVFFSTDRNGLYMSTDNGDTWSQTTGLGIQPPGLNCIHTIGNRIFLGVASGGIITSTDDGNSWNNCGPLGNYDAAQSLASKDNRLFAVSFSWSGGDALFRSDNFGASWLEVSPPGMPYIRSVTTDANYVIVSTDWGVFRSSDYGITWSLLGLQQEFNYTCINVNGNYIIGSRNLGIHTSTDNGQTWLNTGINPDLTVHTLHTAGNSVFLGCDGQLGLRISRNKGDTFTEYTNLGTSYARVIAQRGGDLFVGTNNYTPNTGGIYKSTDNGVSWDFRGIIGKDVFGIAFKGNFLFACTWFDGIFRTSNDGNSWIQMNQGLPSNPIKSLAVIGNTIFAATQTGVFKSDNDGMSWNPAGLATSDINSFAVHNNKLYAATSNGIFLLEASGNWSQLGSFTQEIAVVRSVEGNLVIGGMNLLMKSIDEGNTWISIRDNLPQSHFVDFTINDQYAYVATWNQGLRRRPVGEVLTGIGDHVSAPYLFKLGQNFPNPFNPETTIEYTVINHGKVSIKLYDLLGTLITTLVDEERAPGEYSIKFFAGSLASGTYFYRLTTEDGSVTRRLMILK